MGALIGKVVHQSLEVIFLTLFMMVLVDVVNIYSKGRVALLFQKGRRARQYFLSSFIGGVPGCVGGFMTVSLYMHGIIGFGALAGSMAAAAGDEAFVMLALFPGKALVLFAALFVAGAGIAWASDWITGRWGIPTSADCTLQQVHPEERQFSHYLRTHLWQHIVRKHLLRISAWTFCALLAIELGLKYGNLERISEQYPLALLFAGGLVGLIPESGPSLIFVSMFAGGLIPFSVLFTNALVQDGHGMLPLLSFSVRDAVLVKGFNFVFGTLIGLALYMGGF